MCQVRKIGHHSVAKEIKEAPAADICNTEKIAAQGVSD
jgi:hypothetical protein